MRKITVIRAKKFVGSMMTFDVYLDGVKIQRLQNGETCTFEVVEHKDYLLKIKLETLGTMESPDFTIPAGDSDITILAKPKMGFIRNKIIIEQVDNK